MIAIEVADERQCAALCRRTGFTGDTALLMTQGKAVIGEALCRLKNSRVEVVYLHAPDASLTDALLRAALNASMERGALTAALLCDELFSFACSKGYCRESDPPELQIADFFEKTPCGG